MKKKITLIRLVEQIQRTNKKWIEKEEKGLKYQQTKLYAHMNQRKQSINVEKVNSNNRTNKQQLFENIKNKINMSNKLYDLIFRHSKWTRKTERKEEVPTDVSSANPYYMYHHIPVIVCKKHYEKQKKQVELVWSVFTEHKKDANRFSAWLLSPLRVFSLSIFGGAWICCCCCK